MESLSTKAFLLTVSTKSDIKTECVEKIRLYIRQKCDYYYAVLERGSSGKLHMHAIMLYRDHKEKKQLRNNIWTRYVSPFHSPERDGSIGSIAVKMQVAPGPAWYDEYLRKEDDVEVVASHWDVAAVSAYFPDADTQSLLQASHG